MTSPLRLEASRLAGLPETVARPAYERARVTTGIVHLGLGAFARAHLALYTEDALAAGDRDWGILGVNLNSPEAEEALKPQDGLYTLLTRDERGTRAQVVGSVLDVTTASRNLPAVLAALARPETRIVSLTITEKGYGLDAATGRFEESHPLTAADLANPQAPRSAPALIVEALRRRRAAGFAPFTVMSCDNLAHNGAKARAAVVGFASLVDPELAAFLEREVAFPSTMVDRITPATSEADRAEAVRLIGVEDAWPVVAEPFRQWVVEDRFPQGRPRWEASGALMVEDVGPYEVMKLRCLNGAHSTLAYLAVSAGIETVAEAMDAPGFADLIDALWRKDILPTLKPVPGVDLAEYTRALERRFRNPAIRHRTIQISADGSQKLPQRLVRAALDRLGEGEPPRVIALSIAAWMRFLLGRTEAGAPYAVADPLADQLSALARESTSSARDMTRALLGVSSIFPSELSGNEGFRSVVEASLATLLQRGVRAAVAETLAAEASGEG